MCLSPPTPESGTKLVMSYSNWIWEAASALVLLENISRNSITNSFRLSTLTGRQAKSQIQIQKEKHIWRSMAGSISQLLISACKHILTKMSTTCDTHTRRRGPNNSICPSDICLSYRNTINNVIWHANLFMKITDERNTQKGRNKGGTERSKKYAKNKRSRNHRAHAHMLHWQWAAELQSQGKAGCGKAQKGKTSKRQKAKGKRHNLELELHFQLQLKKKAKDAARKRNSSVKRK